MSTLATPIIDIVTMSIRLRPRRSPKWAEQDAAERAGEVAGGERAEARHRADERVELGEEDPVEHDRGRGRVEQEVVVLDHGADEARQHGTPELGAGAGGLRHRDAPVVSVGADVMQSDNERQ
jgi:hypothetical protein